MSSAIQQPRKPKGQPTGGEFDHKSQSDDLLESLDEAPETSTALSAEEILDMAAASGRHWWHATSHDPHVDADDLAQDAALSLLLAQESGIDVRDPKGYIHTSARKAVSRNGFLRHEDQRAKNMLNDWYMQFIDENGRPPTNFEMNEEAQRIRDDWHDPRHRPAPDFHLVGATAQEPIFDTITMNGRLSSGDQTDPQLALSNKEASPLGQAVEAGFNPRTLSGKIAASAAGMAVTDSRYAQTERVQNAWDALCEHSGAPMVLSGQLSRAKASQASHMVAEAGGAHAVATAWENGEVADDAPEVEALFAPFGAESITDRSAVTAQLGRIPADQANAVWEGAVYKANSRNAAQVAKFVDAELVG